MTFLFQPGAAGMGDPQLRKLPYGLRLVAAGGSMLMPAGRASDLSRSSRLASTYCLVASFARHPSVQTSAAIPGSGSVSLFPRGTIARWNLRGGVRDATGRTNSTSQNRWVHSTQGLANAADRFAERVE